MTTAPSRTSKSRDLSVREIIEKARVTSLRAPASGALILSALSALLLWMSVPPLDWGPLAWLAPVPLIALVRIPQRTRWMYAAIYGCSFCYTIVTLQWMRLGHPAMYLAWFALAVYVAMYLPVFVLLSRLAYHRFAIPLVVTAPVIWTGLEYLRAHLMTGFAWYFLGHTQYRWLEIIQVSDVVGAYGVSFLMLTTAAALAALIPLSALNRLKLLPPGVECPPETLGAIVRSRVASIAFASLLFAAVLTYGYVRRGQAEFTQGPRTALIQGNFTSAVKHDPNERYKIFRTHHRLTGEAVKHQPELIVWPETMYRDPLLLASPDLDNRALQKLAPMIPPDAWRRSQVPLSLKNLSAQAGATMIVGLSTAVAAPGEFSNYNSAVLVDPQAGVKGRYDKLHRVIFGEYIPLRDYFPWLQKLTPFADSFGIDPGDKPEVFQVGQWNAAPVICFEDTVPHLIRNIAAGLESDKPAGKPVDFFVNLTNDGWFHGSSELNQHLITAIFRAVECRTPMVRAVNTGISAFVDGDGMVREPEVFFDGDLQERNSMRDPDNGRWHKSLNAALVDYVPLDNRRSFYVAGGDWFAFGCLAACVLTLIASFFQRRDRRQIC